jgi:hypothetical protein
MKLLPLPTLHGRFEIEGDGTIGLLRGGWEKNYPASQESRRDASSHGVPSTAHCRSRCALTM